MRLMWRYNELNDKATVEYYRLANMSKVTVVRKPASLTHSGIEASARPAEVTVAPPPTNHAPAVAAPMASVPNNRPNTQGTGATVPAMMDAPVPVVPPRKGTAPKPTTTTVKLTSKPTTVAAAASTTMPPSGPTASAGLPPSGPKRSQSADASRPSRSSNAASATAASIDVDPELLRLRQAVSQLEQQVRAQPQALKPSMDTNDPVILRKQLDESRTAYTAALERIAELERTVQRYQSLVKMLSIQASY